MGKAAEEFFGKDFSVVAKEEKPTESSSKAFSFFGIDFGIRKVEKPPVELPKPLPEPSKPVAEIDSVFSKLLKAESGGKHMDDKGNLITSPVGAEGITQLMPKTAANPGFGIQGVKDRSEGEYLRVGREYLTKLHEKFNGDWEKTLAAYNSGMGNVQKAVGKAERFGGDWKEHLPKKEETLPYINTILGKK